MKTSLKRAKARNKKGLKVSKNIYIKNIYVLYIPKSLNEKEINIIKTLNKRGYFVFFAYIRSIGDKIKIHFSIPSYLIS